MEAAGAVVDWKTRGKHSDKIAKYGQKATDAVENFGRGGSQRRQGPSRLRPVDLAADVEGRCNSCEDRSSQTVLQKGWDFALLEWQDLDVGDRHGLSAGLHACFDI